MTIGTSLFLIALGAVLKFAVTASVSGISIATIGLILMIVGIAGLLLSLLYLNVWRDRLNVWRDRRRGDVVVRDRYVERDPVL